MKVLIFGASGFIGFASANAFVRAGHTVIGQTRSAATARILEQNEIYPLLCDLEKAEDVAHWHKAIDEADVVIDCVGGGNISKVCGQILQAAVNSARENRPNGPPLSYLYTSGTWIHGDHPQEEFGSTSDRGIIKDSMPLTAWRLIHEQAALQAGQEFASSFTANVVRPSLLYGRSASLIGELFSTAFEGTVRFGGTGKERIATIHTDDLANLFVLVAEKAYVVKGIVFEGSNPYPESLAHIIEQLILVSGAKKEPVYSTPTDPFHEALASTNLLRPTLGKSLLGWTCSKAPLAEGMETYYRAWLATKDDQKTTSARM